MHDVRTHPGAPVRPEARLLTDAQRELRAATIRWAMAHGRPLDAQTLTVLIAARADRAAASRHHLHRWTTAGVEAFLFGELAAWCRRNGVPLPAHPGETLLTYLAFLDAHRRLAPGSSDYPRLHTTVVRLCGLEPDGRRFAGTAEARILQFPRSRHTRVLHPAEPIA